MNRAMIKQVQGYLFFLTRLEQYIATITQSFTQELKAIAGKSLDPMVCYACVEVFSTRKAGDPFYDFMGPMAYYYASQLLRVEPF